MKTRRMRNFLILWSIIVILFGSSFSAAAQHPSSYHPQGLFFNLQFVMNISWNANDLEEPISPGDLRQVTVHIEYAVWHGLFGRMLLQILSGTIFQIHFFVEETPEWCTAWIDFEDMMGEEDDD